MGGGEYVRPAIHEIGACLDTGLHTARVYERLFLRRSKQG